MPTKIVRASFLSSFFGDPVYAQANTNTNIVKLPQLGSNSQTLSLLQANVSFVSVLENNDKTKGKTKEIDTNANINIVSKNALMPAVSPNSIKATGGVDMENFEGGADDISVYVVRKGDSIAQIAEMFDVSTNTILWTNDLKKGDKLKEGDVLFILPVSGVQHTVVKGETLATIAKKYKVDMDTITAFNGLDTGAVLAVGDELVIPDAEMPNDPPRSNGSKSGSGTSTVSKIDVFGYFTHPLPQMKRRSQGPHGPGGRGIDMAAPTGTPIIAAASGKVLLARNGYNGGYGNMIIIQHSNGTKTLYAHMSKLATTTGAQVSQGEVIGYVGSTGRSTGPHLHFEVQGAKNPF